MKQSLLFLALLLLTHIAQAQAPVAHYPFNGNANDAVGTLNGTANGATLTTDRFGNANQAYAFNGSASIDFSGLPTTVTDNWTVSVWVKPASLNQVAMFVLVGYDDTIGGFNGYALGIGSDGSASDKFQGWVGSIAFLPTGYSFASTEIWYHVLMRRANGTTSFFVNGALVNQSTASTPLTPTDFTIGSINNNRFFNGSLDEVRVYDRALSDAEVGQLYGAESTFPLTLSASGPITCTALSATLTASNSVTGLTYAYAGPSGTVPGSGSTVVISQSGIYSVTATTTNGFSATASITVGDATDGFVSLPTDGRIAIGAMGTLPGNGSISFRMNSQMLVDFRNILTTNRYGNDGIRFEQSNQGFDVIFGKGGVLQGISSPTLTPNTLYHIAVTWNQANLTGKLYIDGVLTATKTDLTEFYSAYASVQIGVGYDDSRYFRGSLDEVAFWTKELSALEVQAMQSGPLTGGESGLLAYYNMNQSGSGAGLTVLNNATATAGQYNGTTVGDVVFGGQAPGYLSLLASGTLTCSQNVTLTATGGTSYTFSGPGGTAEGIVSQNAIAGTAVVSASGLYSVTATNASGCTSVTTTTVSGNTTALTASMSINPGTPTGATLTCLNTSVTLTAISSATALRWSDNSTGTTLVVSTSGTYSFTATGTNGCTATSATTISSNTSSPTASLTVSGPLTCAQTSVTLTAEIQVGNSYIFRNASGVIASTNNMAEVSAEGGYSVVVTGSNGCTANNNLTVSSNTVAPGLSLMPGSTTLTCANPSVTLTVTSSATALRWSTGATGNPIIVTSAGTYAVTATGTNGCTATANTTVSNSTSAPGLTVLVSGIIGCTQTSVTLTASGTGIGGPFSYAFARVGGGSGLQNPNATTGQAEVNAGGTYSVTVTAIATGCSSVNTAVVNSNTTAPTASISPNSAMLTCLNSSVTLTAISSATALRWSDNSTGTTLVVSTSGTYSFTATGANGCTAVSNTVTVGQSLTTAVSLISSAPGFPCVANPSLVLTASLGFSNYRFMGQGMNQTGGSNQATATTAGVYSVTATTNSCSATASLTLTGATGPLPNPIFAVSGPCSATSITLTALGGFRYVFSGQGGTLSGIADQFNGTRQTAVGGYLINETPLPPTGWAVVTQPGTYTVLVTGENGCQATTTLTVTTIRCQ